MVNSSGYPKRRELRGTADIVLPQMEHSRSIMYSVSELPPTLVRMTNDEHRWHPPEHPDPPEDQPLGVDAPDNARPVDGYPPVVVELDFTVSGHHTVPGFVEQTSADRVFVQVVHMGFPHRLWVPRDRVATRTLKPGRR